MKKALSLLVLAVTVSFVSCSEKSSDVSVSAINNSVQSENKSEATTGGATENSYPSEERSISDSDEDTYKLEADQIFEQYVKSMREESEEAYEYISSHKDLDHKHSLDKKYGVYQEDLQSFFHDFEFERQKNFEYLYDTEYIGELDEALYENVDMYYWNDYGWYEIRGQYSYEDPRSHINVLRGYEYELDERWVRNGEVVTSDTNRLCVVFVEGQGWKICASSEELASNDHYKTDEEQNW